MYVHCIYTVYTVDIYSTGLMFNSGIVIHYIGWGFQSPNPQEIHCFQWEYHVWFVRLFQEHNLGVKQDLPVIQNTIQQDSKSLESYDTAFPTAWLKNWQL